jgi:hypothetical protein
MPAAAVTTSIPMLRAGRVTVAAPAETVTSGWAVMAALD